MAHTEPQGLLAIWADVDADYQPEFVKWHNCEHVAERVSIAGFHVGHRYRAMDEERDFFMVYETATADVMQSAPYLHSQNNPTPWTRQSIAHFRQTLRTIYRLVAAVGQQPALDAPYVLLVRSNPPPEPGGADEVDALVPRGTFAASVCRAWHAPGAPVSCRCRGFLASSRLNGRYTGPRRGRRSFSPCTRCSRQTFPTLLPGVRQRVAPHGVPKWWRHCVIWSVSATGWILPCGPQDGSRG